MLQVEIQVELEELEELEATREDAEEVFDLDPFDTLVGQDKEESDDDGDIEDTFSDLSSDAGGGDDDDENASPEPAGPLDAVQVQDLVRKLDAFLKLLFDHFARYQRTIFTPSTTRLSTPRSDSPSSLLGSAELPPRPSSPATLERGRTLRRQQFYSLLAIFERTILRTFKSRYTQFLVFWYASLDAEFADQFQGMLLSRALLEPGASPVARAAATSYIGSLVSRALFVDGAAVRAVTGVLCAYLRAQLDAVDATAVHGADETPKDVQNGMFYAATQAVFLVFCFRWRDLVQKDEEGEADVQDHPASGPKQWLPELKVLQRVVTSPLNPLKVSLR